MYHYYKRDKYGRWILLKAVLPDFPLTEKEETTAKKKFSFSKNIFIVHGREAKPKLELARILEKLGFNTIILSEQPDKGRTIIEKLEEESIEIGYAFVILTPDDFGGSIEELRKVYERWKDVEEAQEIEKVFKARARQNVVLELGYFVGKIGRNRVCCLYKGEVELPSDIHGVLFKKFNESVEECYKGIIEELKAAGYDIKI
jgi:predicted nucleotide-binding protein